MVQHKHFFECFNAINSKSKSANSLPRYLRKLQPVVIDGVLRVGGRSTQAPLDFDVRHTILLPNSSHFTELVIRKHHLEVGRSGASHTWASLRRQFWIIKGGAAVRKSIGKCVTCRKHNSKVGEHLMADIPECRLQFDQPSFYQVGVDYFGPLPVKLGRSIVKRYGCVFTCLTMRAIHIEIGLLQDEGGL